MIVKASAMNNPITAAKQRNNAKRIIGLFTLTLFLLVFLATPHADATLTLPSLPSLPSGDEGEVGGIIVPNDPTGEENTARPKEAQGGAGNASTGTVRENKNRINQQPLGSRIDQRMGKKDSRVSTSQNVEEVLELGGDIVPVENTAAPEGRGTLKTKKPGFGFNLYPKNQRIKE